MILFLVLIVVLLIGLTTAAVMGRVGGFMADPTSSQSFGWVPDGSDGLLLTDDLAQLRFDQALRGYRMDQVDQVIDALAARVRELESTVPSRPDTGATSPATGDAAEVRSEPQE